MLLVVQFNESALIAIIKLLQDMSEQRAVSDGDTSSEYPSEYSDSENGDFVFPQLPQGYHERREQEYWEEFRQDYIRRLEERKQQEQEEERIAMNEELAMNVDTTVVPKVQIS